MSKKFNIIWRECSSDGRALAYSAILQVGEVQDLGLDLQRDIFMLSHPRATSPIDFLIHALEVLT